MFDQFLPWKVCIFILLLQRGLGVLTPCYQEHLFELEAAGAVEPSAIYVVYPDESGNWRIQAVPEAPESFASRKALPEVWRGLRDDELTKASGVDGGIFVHASGFIGGKKSPFPTHVSRLMGDPGNKTKEGALKIATLALDM